MIARSRRADVLVAALAAAATSLSACGIPLDEAPEVVSSPTSSGSAAPTTAADGASAEVAVYFLRGDRLEAQRYPVAGSPQLRDALGFALARPAEGSDPELRTSVPPGTTLRGVQVTGDVASIDLSSDIDDVSGLAQKEAFAQIVFTALAFTEVQQVRFLVEGRPIDAPTDDGNLSLISADNYDKPLNPR